MVEHSTAASADRGTAAFPWQPGEPTPTPTRDREHALADLRRFGYCIVERALEGAALDALRRRFVEQAQAELEAGLAFEDGGPRQRLTNSPEGTVPRNAFTRANGGINQRLWMLVNKGRVFRDLVVHPFMTDLVAALLGRDFLLSTLSGNIAKPGGQVMGLHTDQWWMPRPLPRGHAPVAPGDMRRGEFDGLDDGDAGRAIAAPAACNVMYFLNDFTEANGGTRLVPCSHLTGQQPPPDVPHSVPSLAAAGPAGTAVLFDGRVWHGTGANGSNGPRLGLLATYCGPQFRPQENYTLGIDPAVYAEASDELLARLGFKVWNAYGRVGDPSVEFVRPGGWGLVGEMQPQEKEVRHDV